MADRGGCCATLTLAVSLLRTAAPGRLPQRIARIGTLRHRPYVTQGHEVSASGAAIATIGPIGAPDVLFCEFTWVRSGQAARWWQDGTVHLEDLGSRTP